MVRGMYIDLDALFDTRIGLLNLLDKKLSIDLVDSDDYKYRFYDEFEYISNNVFINFYRERDVSILKNSYITRAIELLFVELDVILTEKIDLGEDTPVTLDVNSYPYVLTDNEKELFKEAIQVYGLTPNLTINILYEPITELTLAKAGGKYSIMIMYDATTWLDYQLSVSLNSSAIDTKLYGAALIKDALVFSKVKALENIFKMQSELYTPYISYTAIGVEYFCTRPVMTEKIKEKYKSSM